MCAGLWPAGVWERVFDAVELCDNFLISRHALVIERYAVCQVGV